MSWRDRYSFWIDRTVDGCRYRFSEYVIKRHPVVGPEHWDVYKEFDDPRETASAWRGLCDRAAEEERTETD